MKKLNDFVNIYTIKKAYDDLFFYDNLIDILSKFLFKFIVEEYKKDCIIDTENLKLLCRESVKKYIDDQDIQFNYDKNFLVEEVLYTFNSVFDYIEFKTWNKCIKKNIKMEK